MSVCLSDTQLKEKEQTHPYTQKEITPECECRPAKKSMEEYSFTVQRFLVEQNNNELSKIL